MLIGTIVLRDSFPVVAFDKVVISPIYITFFMVKDVIVEYKFARAKNRCDGYS